MNEYNFRQIEEKWQTYWANHQTFRTETDKTKPKYYVLDMFPYPSGAGLHVGHPLGYIATDIVSRYKRLKGFNVLHPMGYDSFGLPAEQYALQTGQHPAVTTEKNIETYRKQLDAIGFSYDWNREVRTSDPAYYKWTQWIFIQLFNSWYNRETDKAEPIETLVAKFEKEGSLGAKAFTDQQVTPSFSAADWKGFNEAEKYRLLLGYRLAYVSNSYVNWCPALGTVLANEEVKDGVSERGGHPVVRKEMPQWSLRITAYADRLLADLDLVDWPEPVKEMQRNWIGRSKGCMLKFNIKQEPYMIERDLNQTFIEVFTTRVDTTFGVTYLTLAPEHELVEILASPEQKEEVEKYIHYARNRSERDRMSDVKTVSGAFTGAYVINPFNGAEVPVWIGEYVLAGYGTGAVMAVPSSDTRDYAFAQKFGLPIIQVQEGAKTDISKEDFDPKAGAMIHSGFLNGLTVPQAIEAAIQHVESIGAGYARINYKIRDALFSRQRYWGEPFPVYYKDGMPYVLNESELPLVLPEVDQYKPTESGEPPLARATDWKTKEGYPLETNTMPGWAGSSWYFLRYMDPTNENEFASREALDYWQEVDLYLGGSEHATGHLLYSRFWHKFLYDLGYVKTKEYAKKLINQGMISSYSYFVDVFWGFEKKTGVNYANDKYEGAPPEVFFIASDNYENRQDISINGRLLSGCSLYKKLRIPIDYVVNNQIPKDKLIDFVSNDQLFKSYDREIDLDNVLYEISENGNEYIVPYSEVEKMSKSKHNVVNPDDVIGQYGADTLRLYEMFLGPLEMSKPWNTTSISGVSRFLKNVWKLFYDEKGNWLVTDEMPVKQEFKTLHKTIRKVEEDIERFSFNTSVSTFMVCVNELNELHCHKKGILQEFLVLLSPYAPHIAEELWERLGNNDSITYARFPVFNPAYIQESTFEYPVSINGKLRFKMEFSLDTQPSEIEKEILSSLEMQKWLEGKAPKKVIVVPHKIVNVVI